MLGIDIERAHGLVEELQTWSVATSEAGELVAAAEALCDLTTGVHPLLDQLGARGRALARTVDTAVARLLEHETKIAAAFDGLLPAGGFWAIGPGFEGHDVATRAERAALAQGASDRIRNALAREHLPSRRDYEALESIFASATTDEKTAAAAMALALRGVPAAAALEITTPEQVTEIFDRVVDAMRHGHSPAAAGLDAALFPPAYARWHELISDRAALRATQREIVDTFRSTLELTSAQRHEAERTIAAAPVIDRQLAALELDLGLGARVAIDGGETPAFVATTATGAYHGTSAQAWLGRELARVVRVDRMPEAELRLAAGLIAANVDTPVGFFSTLGAQATGRIPSELLARGERELFDDALSQFATGLAAASMSGRLGFSGADLVSANELTPNDYLAGYATFGNWAQAELLLFAPGHDRAFLVDAVTTSLRERPAQRTYWADLPSDTGMLTQADPRLVALQAAVLNEAGPAVVAALAAGGELDLLIEAQFGARAPFTSRADGRQWDPAHRLLVDTAASRDPSRLVVSHVAARTSELPLDLTVANGVSGLMAQVLLDHLNDARRPDFLAAFGHVLEVGAGLDIEAAAVGAIHRDLHDLLVAGSAGGNQNELVDFVGDLQAIGNDHLAADAAARDRAVDNTVRLAGSGIGGAGLAATVASSTPAGLAIGLLGLGLSLWGPGSDHEAAQRETQFDDDRISRVQRQHDIAVALVASGRVRTVSGNPVSLVRSPHPSSFAFLDRYQVVDDMTGRVRYEGNFALEDTAGKDFGEIIPADRFNVLLYLPQSGDTTTMGQVIKNYMYSETVRLNRFDG